MKKQKNPKEKSYSPLRPLVDAGKIWVNSQPYDPKKPAHKLVYNKFKSEARAVSPRRRQLADFIIQNLANSSDQLGNNPGKQYGSLDYVNLLKKPYIDPKTGQRMDVYNGRYDTDNAGNIITGDKQVITLTPFNATTNPLSTLIHEGTHALDDSYMRTHQNEAIDYLARQGLKNDTHLKQLLEDTQEIIPDPDFSQGYGYDMFFKPRITEDFQELGKDIGQNNINSFKKAKQALNTIRGRQQNPDPADTFMSFSEIPAYSMETLYKPWTASHNPQANEFLSNIIQGVQKNFGEFGLKKRNHSHIIQGFKDRLQNLSTINPAVQAQLAPVNIPLKRNRSGQLKIGNPQKKAGGGYVSGNNSYDPYLNTDNYEPQLTLSDYLANQMSDSGYDTGSGENSYMPYTNTDETEGQQYSFREGGSVEREDLPRLAELIREQGRDGDTELAHINPIEAHILKSLGGSGTINPKTGLPQFGFLDNPGKALKGSLGGGLGAVIGNMIMPGLGGIIGGALGGAAGSAVRGRKDYMGAGLRGAAMGAMLPSAASAAGWGANAMGAKGLGTTLTNYGNTNAILPSIGLGGSSGGQYASPAATMMSLNGMGGEASSPVQYMQAPAVDNRSFMEKLGDNSKDYLTQPSNLLALGTAYAQYAGREKAVKPKTPEQLADEERRYRNASRLTPAELEAEEAYNFARKEAARKLKYNAIREKLGEIGSLHRKVNSPEEYEEKGRWLEYYDNPEFAGEPIRMKDGGNVHSPYNYMTEEVALPNSLIGYLQGNTGGQDDLIDAKLSDGEYVIDAATVSDLGDGNNGAGARKLDAFRERVRRHKRGGKISLPPKSKSLEYYLRG